VERATIANGAVLPVTLPRFGFWDILVFIENTDILPGTNNPMGVVALDDNTFNKDRSWQILSHIEGLRRSKTLNNVQLLDGVWSLVAVANEWNTLFAGFLEPNVPAAGLWLELSDDGVNVRGHAKLRASNPQVGPPAANIQAYVIEDIPIDYNDTLYVRPMGGGGWLLWTGEEEVRRGSVRFSASTRRLFIRNDSGSSAVVSLNAILKHTAGEESL
jgi:hypothetical protein